MMSVKPSTIFTGDNLPILRGFDDALVDLIYLDPPFNKKRQFSAPIGSKAAGAFFDDAWRLDDIDKEEIGLLDEVNPKLADVINVVGNVNGNGYKAYLLMMGMRIMEMHRILKPTGSFYLHCDATMSHSLKLVLDSIFGVRNFRNELIWTYSGGGTPRKDYPRKHDVIFRYSKTDRYTFNVETKPYKENTQQVGKHSTLSGGKAIDLRKGTPITDTWTDIKTVTGWNQERTGYPTQKPLDLLRRIIKSSSNKGDWVLDPFCGCATTCVAAQDLKRKWIGIDISKKAVSLIKVRFKEELLLYSPTIIERSDIPVRGKQKPLTGKRKEALKRRLFGEQGGICNLCKHETHMKLLHIDHIVPKVKGGGEEEDNMQLLCGHCNSVKGGNRTMAEARARLKEIGVIT